MYITNYGTYIYIYINYVLICRNTYLAHKYSQRNPIYLGGTGEYTSDMCLICWDKTIAKTVWAVVEYVFAKFVSFILYIIKVPLRIECRIWTEIYENKFIQDDVSCTSKFAFIL